MFPLVFKVVEGFSKAEIPNYIKCCVVIPIHNIDELPALTLFTELLNK